jgi:hypothetical protein
MSQKPSFKKREEDRGAEFMDYWPLFSLIFITAAAALALVIHHDEGLFKWMHYFMGFFLCSFAMLKIFHLSAFADGFQMYDLIARRARIYAIIYPFIELFLGLGYLSYTVPVVIYTLTVIVMAMGSIGVLRALGEGLDINCPCMGSVLDVPLSTVTLTEDIGMGVMAAGMLVMTVFVG